METQTVKTTHPMLIIAALAVTLFSLAGIATMFGWIPTSTGGQGAALTSNAAPAPSATTEHTAQAPEQTKAAPQPQARAKERPAREHVASSESRPRAPRVARAEPQTEPARAEAPAQVASAAPVRRICLECGVIESFREVELAGKPSGIGAIGGAVAGSVVGHQMGNGRGQDLMTVLGAVGGGIAGHQIEKNVKKTKEYQITVRFEDGNARQFTQSTPPVWRVGDKVKVVDDTIHSNG